MDMRRWEGGKYHGLVADGIHESIQNTRYCLCTDASPTNHLRSLIHAPLQLLAPLGGKLCARIWCASVLDIFGLAKRDLREDLL